MFKWKLKRLAVLGINRVKNTFVKYWNFVVQWQSKVGDERFIAKSKYEH